MAIPTKLGGKIYASRKTLLTAVQAYVKDAPVYTPLWDDLPYDIFNEHPHRDQKIGVGMVHIELRNTEYGNRGFYVVRLDKTSIDFSWRVALGFAKSGASLSAAAREAVRDQIAAVSVKGGHVHHEGKSFRDLLIDGWLKERDAPPELIHGEVHDYFRYPADEVSWQEYHRRHAVLRAVSVEEHKQIHREKRT